MLTLERAVCVVNFKRIAHCRAENSRESLFPRDKSPVVTERLVRLGSSDTLGRTAGKGIWANAPRLASAEAEPLRETS